MAQPVARARAYARQNPPATANGIAGAVVAVLVSLASWGLSELPATVPAEVIGSLHALVVAVAAAVGVAVGRVAQRFTYPAEFVEGELLDAEHAIERAIADSEG